MIRTIARRQRGFSLIELAIGLVIVATLLSALLVPLGTQMDQRRTAATQRALDESRDALVGFAIANGRLPCPAVDAATGIEAFAAGGSAADGNCATATGFLPAVTLGLTGLDGSGYLLDAFGGRVRYAVALPSALAPIPDNAFTRTGGMQTSAVMRAIASSNALLTICTAASTAATSCSAGATLASGNAIAITYSLGKNGVDTVRTRDADEEENTTTIARRPRLHSPEA